MLVFISGGEIFLIVLAILIFFGADKIPEFARMMGKGAREFKKATDDIKRELEVSSSDVVKDFKSIGTDLTDSFNKEIAEPIQKTANETQKTFEEYNDQFNDDYYYNDQSAGDDGYGYGYGNEYQSEVQEKADDIMSDTSDADPHAENDSNSETTIPSQA